jgi:PAS domain S-box-containing protein
VVEYGTEATPTAATPEPEERLVMVDTSPLYNSFLTKTYVEYTRHHHPQVDLQSVLREAGMNLYQVEDPAHWFTQEAVDRFHESLVRHTGDPDIPRKVGRYTAYARAGGALRQYMLGLMTPASIYHLMEKNYPLLSRGANIRVQKIGPRRVEITATPKPGVTEKPYQCANRTGIFETFPALFTHEPAAIEHPECFHRGQSCCRYIVTWQASHPLRWRRLRNLTLLGGVLTAVATYGVLPFNAWAALSAAISAGVGFCAFWSERLEKGDLVKTIGNQRQAAEETLLESETRYNNAMLVQEIGQATSTIMDIDQLIQAVMGITEKRLGFDRGMIMLADRGRQRLHYVAGFGHTPAQESLLRHTRFSLDNPTSKGVFVLAMRERRPILVEDLKRIENNLSAKSLEIARQLGSESLICVPIIYENDALGILAVDNSTSRRPLQQTDMSMLIGVASQLAASIVNALSFEKLRDSEKKYRELVETASSAILRVDREGRISFVNEFGQRLLDYSESELLGMEASRFLVPADNAGAVRFDDFVAQICREAKAPAAREVRHVLRSGKEAWLAWTYRPIMDAAGRFSEMLCIGNDVTELKRADQARKELQLQLQRAQKMEAIGTLAGGVAHDLNNILSGIVSYPELLLMDIEEGSPLRKPIITIKKSGERAAAIVHDLLTLARRGVETPEVMNLNQVVTDYISSPEFAKLKLNHPDVTVEAALGDSLLNMVGSPAHLSKTLMNLVVNAAEAMPDGGRVVICTENDYRERLVSGYNEVLKGELVVLRVSDTGIGIPPEDLERIFEPFYTKKTMGRSGTGLGMAVVWGSVKDHRGHIDVKSRVGEGTTATLFFPATRLAVQAQEPVEPDRFTGRGERILVVDDIREQREIAGEILTKLGYRVATAGSGEEALDQLRHHAADLVVLDMIMEPGIDGLETYRRIRALRPEQKTIIASGYSESARVREAQRLGAGTYVRKPYLLKAFGRAVRTALDRTP